ncbi:hypothetical protein X736_26960 [Mesorhizobium sp. L2C089B000]|nr:hypothetical protein X736_26960 [Mesorhizobium sp. L2C089B000]
MGGHFSINAFGRINPGDSARFLDFLDRVSPPPRITVYIDSTGGDPEEAMEMGRMIRNGWFGTAIGKYVLGHDPNFTLMIPRRHIPGSCLSAATLMYIGGRLRYFSKGSQFGVHQFSFKNPMALSEGKSQILSAKMAKYVFEMGVSPEFLEVSSSTLSEHINILSEGDLERMNVVTGGDTGVTWTVHALEGSIYVRGERDSFYGHHKVMLSHVKSTGFAMWAVIEAQGREDELQNFPVVEITLNNDDAQTIDISDRSLRFVNNIYVIVYANITKDEARQIAISKSFGCQIRGSKEAEIFFGIAPMPTEGGEVQLNSLYSMFAD